MFVILPTHSKTENVCGIDERWKIGLLIFYLSSIRRTFSVQQENRTSDELDKGVSED